ncbi:MAG: hypothetical protein AAFZ11_14730, partial [Pseudomonadota bacterium]
CAFVDGAIEPGVLILQSGTYDMEGWVAWVREGAPGGDAALAQAILANQDRESGLGHDALQARSGTRHAGRGACDVLLVQGRSDPQSRPDDVEHMASALREAGRRVEMAVAADGAHRLPPSLATDALERHWPGLAF